MTLKELLEKAGKSDFVDLQALIMFLVFEKEVLSLDDDSSELDLYFKEKHNHRMNLELIAYKRKLNMNYSPNVYGIKVNQKRYKTIYILAETQVQAEAFCRSLMYEPIETSICDDELLMTKFNRKNEEIHVRIKDLKNGKIPRFLGGY